MGKRNKVKQREAQATKAVKENEIKMQEAIQNDQCPVCFDPFEGKDGPPYDNSLGCSNKHPICVPCMRVLVRPNLLAKRGEPGFEFTCPICREESLLDDSHIMVLVKGSWPKLVESMHNALSQLA
jgi:hypothetical protein